MIQPLGDRLLVQQKKTESSLILTEDTKERFPSGVVIAVGSSCMLENLIGATVLFNIMSGERVEYESTEYLLLKSSDILAKVC